MFQGKWGWRRYEGIQGVCGNHTKSRGIQWYCTLLGYCIERQKWMANVKSRQDYGWSLQVCQIMCKSSGKGRRDHGNALFMVIDDLLPALPFQFPSLNIWHCRFFPFPLSPSPSPFTQAILCHSSPYPHPQSKNWQSLPLAWSLSPDLIMPFFSYIEKTLFPKSSVPFPWPCLPQPSKRAEEAEDPSVLDESVNVEEDIDAA